MSAIPLRQTTVEMLSRPIRGRGGFQALMRRIQAGLDGRMLTVSEADIDSLLRAVQGSHVGGFQCRARDILVDFVVARVKERGFRPTPARVLPFTRAAQAELPFGVDE